MDYKKKYLKYKSKYLDLKNLIGAAEGSQEGMDELQIPIRPSEFPLPFSPNLV